MGFIIGVMLWIFGAAIAFWAIKTGLVIIASLFGVLLGFFSENKKKGGSGS